MMTVADFSIGANDYEVVFSIADKGDARFDGPFELRRYPNDDEPNDMIEVEFSTLNDDEREELRRKLQTYAENDADLRRYHEPEEAADRAYDESNY